MICSKCQTTMRVGIDPFGNTAWHCDNCEIWTPFASREKYGTQKSAQYDALQESQR